MLCCVSYSKHWILSLLWRERGKLSRVLLCFHFLKKSVGRLLRLLFLLTVGDKGKGTNYLVCLDLFFLLQIKTKVNMFFLAHGKKYSCRLYWEKSIFNGTSEAVLADNTNSRLVCKAGVFGVLNWVYTRGKAKKDKFVAGI